MHVMLAMCFWKDPIQRVLELMNIGWPSYLVLFGLLFTCGIGVPIPEDVPLLVAGALLGSHKMHNLPLAAALAWCGIIGGDMVLYHLGKAFGLGITRVPFIGRHVTERRILKAERLFDKYGVWVVAVGRLFAGIRGAMVIAAGTMRFNRVKFLIADGLAAMVSGGLFLFLGYKFGQHLEVVEAHIKKGGWYIGSGAIAFMLIFLSIKWFDYKKKQTITEIAIDKAHLVDTPPVAAVFNTAHRQRLP